MSIKLTKTSTNISFGIVALIVVMIVSLLVLGVYIGFSAVIFGLSNYLLGTTFVVWKWAVFSGVTIFILKILFHRNSSKD